MWYHGDPGWAGWLLMSFMMVAFTLVVVALVRGLRDERFARGEIDAEEYKTRRDLLNRR